MPDDNDSKQDVERSDQRQPEDKKSPHEGQKPSWKQPTIVVSIIVGIMGFVGLIAAALIQTAPTYVPPKKWPSGAIAASEAAEYVETVQTVCGKVVDARYMPDKQGAPTFLNYGEPYPDQIFSAVIWGENREKFDPSPEELRYAELCVSGKISLYDGKPEIEVESPSQVKVVGP